MSNFLGSLHKKSQIPKFPKSHFWFSERLKDKKDRNSLTFIIDIYLYIYKYISIPFLVVNLKIVKMGKWDFGTFSFSLYLQALRRFVKKQEEPTAEISVSVL